MSWIKKFSGLLAALVILFVAFVPVSFAQQAAAVISWTDVINDAGYKIERNVDGGLFTQIGTTPVDVVNFNDTPLSLGVLYCWQIIATNTFGDGLPSAQVCGSAEVPGQVLGVQIIISPAP